MKWEFAPFRASVLIYLLTGAAVASGAGPVTGLGDILIQIWDHSPQLDGQATQSRLAVDDRWRRFIVNEPQFQFSNSDDNTAHSYGLSLTTTFPGKAFALTRVDAAKDRAQRSEYFSKKYDLTKIVTQAYLDCATAQATYDLQIATSADLQTVFQSLNALYETGHSTQAEKIGSELQSRQAKLDLLTAWDKQTVLCNKLGSLLPTARDGHPLFTISKLPLPDDLDDRVISALGSLTSDQNRSVAAIDTAESNAHVAAWSQLPDLTLNFTRNHYIYLPGSPSGKEWATTYGLSVTLPLLFPFHETVEVDRAKSQAAIDRNVAEIQKIAADSDQVDGAKEYQRNKARLIELRAKDLALGEALVESTYSAYREGKLGYAELVLSRRTLTDLRTQDIQLRASIVNARLKCLTRCNTSETTAPPLEVNSP